MGRHELFEALQREGRETMAAISARDAAEEQELRCQADARRAELRKKHEEERELLCRDRKRALIAKATREAALIRLRAEHALALRLQARARLCLKELRSDNAEQLFGALAAELPAMPWQTIWTAPEDAPLAATLFPDVTIIPDVAISGGLKTATTDMHLTVDNTLETRLERFWPDMLPQLLAELRGRLR